MDLAKELNRLRIIPRILLGGFGWFTIWYVTTVTEWYMALPVIERTLEASGFLGITIPAVIGLFGQYAKVYICWKLED